MSKAHEHPSDDLVALNLRVPESFRHRFKVWCATNRREMTEVTIALANEAMAGKIVVPPAKARARKK